MSEDKKPGPLAGITVIEMAGIGPAPLACLMLSELGARVVRIERLKAERAFLAISTAHNLDGHGRELLKVDLKRPEGAELVLRLLETADILVEGFRPGVMERFGLGTDAVLARNPRLIYGRMTGFGQEGPLAARAGHDLTYLAYSGVLGAIGPKGGKPLPPLNLVADFGGGSMFLIMGLLAALVERGVSGRGQVVDAAMIDGASMLAAPFFSFLAAGIWRDKRGSNLLDSGAPFYDTYETSDGRHIAVACLEPQFFAEFARLLPLEERLAKAQYDQSLWPDLREAIARRISERGRDEWVAVFGETDACVAPVLSFAEAAEHPHNRARATHVTPQGWTRPAPAPRFSRTPGSAGTYAAASARDILATSGISEDEASALVTGGVVGE